MQTNWANALAFCWRPNNDGQAYHVTPGDAGGGTSWGVIEATWQNAVVHGIVTGTLKAASQNDCGLVLKAGFWNVIKGDDLPPGLDLMVFDLAMMAGPGNAARTLHRALGNAVTTVVDTATVTLALSSDHKALASRLHDETMHYFEQCAAYPKFGHGWERRASDAYTVAGALMSGAPVTVEMGATLSAEAPVQSDEAHVGAVTQKAATTPQAAIIAAIHASASRA